uniref:Uncharacterized protein n=1 Tax=Romanomermis culicivorax TaxID=13658 RepID=A0A915HXK6_ROMCU
MFMLSRPKANSGVGKVVEREKRGKKRLWQKVHVVHFRGMLEISCYLLKQDRMFLSGFQIRLRLQLVQAVIWNFHKEMCHFLLVKEKSQIKCKHIWKLCLNQLHLSAALLSSAPSATS